MTSQPSAAGLDRSLVLPGAHAQHRRALQEAEGRGPARPARGRRSRPAAARRAGSSSAPGARRAGPRRSSCPAARGASSSASSGRSSSLMPSGVTARAQTASAAAGRVEAWTTVCGTRAIERRYKSARMPGIGAFISAGRSLDSALERVRRADRLGFDSVYTTQIAARDALSLLMAYASVSERVRLAPAWCRSSRARPSAMAQAAATIDEFSGGRMVLGLGVSHQVTVENWFDARDRKAGDPDARVRRASCARSCAARRRPRASSSTPGFGSWAMSRGPELPIYIAALSPNMLRLAGRDRGRGDALALQPRLHPRRRRARGDGGPRAGRQGARRLRRRRGRAGGAHRRPGRRPRHACART